MDATTRIEAALAEAIGRASGPGAPPELAAAMHHAVFPRGARIRPRLCLSVAAACGDDQPTLADGAAASIELLHCASLVHDDLPCFDDAAIRRGRPSVHCAYGEPLAVLAGDAMIVLAFQVLARAAAGNPERLPAVMTLICRAAGMPSGIVAGQAWEYEPEVDLATYHRAKTGSLFAAATMAGAAAAGADPLAWRALGERLGEAYQVADDVRDVAADASDLGKPLGQDAAHGRPSAAHDLGLEGALRRLEGLITGAIESIPACPGAGELQSLIKNEVKRLVPQGLARHAA